MSLKMDYTSVVATPAPSMLQEDVGRESSRATIDGAVIGGALGGALAAAAGVLAVAIVVLIILMLRRKRSNKGSATHPPVDNPIYSGTRKCYN